MYGFDRLESTLVRCAECNASETIEAVLRDVQAFVVDEPQLDDINIVVIKRLVPSGRAESGSSLLEADDRIIQAMLREVDTSFLATAMLGLEIDEHDALYRNMSTRAAGLLAHNFEAARGNYTNDEIGRAIAAIEEKLAKHTERSGKQRPILANELMIKSIFQYVLSPRVIDKLVQNPSMFDLEGAEREATVFFSDMRGATRVLSVLPPKEIYAYFNEYFEMMTQIILDNDGMLDKFVGDEIMAVWGAPVYFDDHAYKACKAALEMQELLEVLRVKWRREGLPEVQVGMGINSGRMVIGSVGTKNRIMYTPFGDQVNLGARLEGTNKRYGTSILISEFTYEMAKDRIVARKVDTIETHRKIDVDSRSEVTIYELVGLRGATENRDNAG